MPAVSATMASSRLGDDDARGARAAGGGARGALYMSSRPVCGDALRVGACARRPNNTREPKKLLQNEKNK